MKTWVVTGAAGLAGSEAVRSFSERGFRVVGIDNDLRKYFFGEEASTRWNLRDLESEFQSFENRAVDIRDFGAIEAIFGEFGRDIELVIHAAAQPSHDWAAKEPFTDFGVNAQGTLNLLEAVRQRCPDAVFIFTSTNKVYGDTPNRLPLVELEDRWEVDGRHPYFDHGIDEKMTIDNSRHSIFGASKLAADIMVQEYGRYFHLKTGVFRGGCLTGPRHSGAELHGFLAYLIKCAVVEKEYRIFGYKGKQVRDNMHITDLVEAFFHFYNAPRCGEVYNMGGSRFSNCSMKEAIRICEDLCSKRMNTTYIETNRIGDHIWWISDVSKFKRHYPEWDLTRDVEDILREIRDYNADRWLNEMDR